MAPKIFYWGIKARAQLAVLIGQFATDGFEWEQSPDWPGMKPETPFGQLPYLVDGDIKIAQSNAIARYLARKYNLQGESDADFGLSESLIEEQSDLLTLVFTANRSDNKEEAYNKVFSETYPKQLEYLENLLQNDFFTTELTAGSLAIFSAFNIALDLESSLLDKFPKLKAFYDRVAALPQIKGYLDQNIPAYVKRS